MPRPATISYEDFVAAARELSEGGQRLTFAAVRIKLGGGSYDVLRRYIDRYAEEQPNREAPLGVPEAVRGGMQALYDQAIAEATRQVRAELDAEAQALAAEREALQIERPTCSNASCRPRPKRDCCANVSTNSRPSEQTSTSASTSSGCACSNARWRWPAPKGRSRPSATRV